MQKSISTTNLQDTTDQALIELLSQQENNIQSLLEAISDLGSNARVTMADAKELARSSMYVAITHGDIRPINKMIGRIDGKLVLPKVLRKPCASWFKKELHRLYTFEEQAGCLQITGKNPKTQEKGAKKIIERLDEKLSNDLGFHPFYAYEEESDLDKEPKAKVEKNGVYYKEKARALFKGAIKNGVEPLEFIREALIDTYKGSDKAVLINAFIAELQQGMDAGKAA